MTRRPRVNVAWHNLMHDRRRLLVAVCGIGFAVVLMFMETGFENALFDSTVKVFDDLGADLIIASKAQYALLSCETFGKQRIHQARACPGVQGVYPVYVELYSGVWKPPGGVGYPIRVVACDPADRVFNIPSVLACAAALQQPDTAMIDSKSKRKHAVPSSPEEVLALGGAELSDRAIRLVGTFEMGTDFISDGTMILSAATFEKCFPFRGAGAGPLGVVDAGVVRVEEGAEVGDVKKQLRRILPDDVEVYTKKEYIRHEKKFWSDSSPIGFVFFMGTTIGFLVGVIICYQILYSDIADHIAEFATLKAIGYRDRYFVGFVLQEAFYLSVLSFIPGLLVSFAVYAGLARYTGLLMILNVERALFVFLLTTLMCIVSGCLAMHKVHAADPADLF